MKRLIPTINGPIQKLVETPKGYVINAQYYPKSTMIAEPFNTIPIYGAIRDLSFDRGTCPGYAGVFGKYYGRKIIDNNDPDICYVFGSTSFDSVAFTTAKIRETAGSAELLLSTTVGIAAAMTNRAVVQTYLGQSNTHIFVVLSYTTSTTMYYGCINKMTLASTWTVGISNIRWGFTRRIYENDNFIWLFVNGYPQIQDIYELDKTTHVLRRTNLLKNRYKSSAINNSFDVVIDRSDTKKEIIFTCADQSGGTTALDIIRVVLDFEKAQPVISDELMVNDSRPVATGDTAIVNDLYYLKDGTDEYLIRIFYEYATTVNATYSPSYGLYVWKIVDNTLTKIQYMNLSTAVLRSSVNVDNACQRIVVGTNMSTIFLTWNKITKQYDMTDVRNNSPWHIGVSQEGIVYTCSVDGNIDIINPIAPSRVTIDAVQKEFVFVGDPIDTVVKVKVQDNLGNQISHTIKLLITSTNGVFKDNTSRSIDVTTLEDRLLEVPITITSGGTLSVNFALK